MVNMFLALYYLIWSLVQWMRYELVRMVKISGQITSCLVRSPSANETRKNTLLSFSYNRYLYVYYCPEMTTQKHFFQGIVVRETTGQKAITPRAQNYWTLCWTMCVRRQKIASVSKGSSWHTPWVVGQVLAWAHC